MHLITSQISSTIWWGSDLWREQLNIFHNGEYKKSRNYERMGSSQSTTDTYTITLLGKVNGHML